MHCLTLTYRPKTHVLFLLLTCFSKSIKQESLGACIQQPCKLSEGWARGWRSRVPCHQILT